MSGNRAAAQNDIDQPLKSMRATIGQPDQKDRHRQDIGFDKFDSRANLKLDGGLFLRPFVKEPWGQGEWLKEAKLVIGVGRWPDDRCREAQKRSRVRTREGKLTIQTPIFIASIFIALDSSLILTQQPQQYDISNIRKIHKSSCAACSPSRHSPHYLDLFHGLRALDLL